MFTRFVTNSEKCRKYAFLGGPPRLLRYYIGGVIKIYYNITWGGSSQFITILQWGGDPKFVLRNIWTAPYCNKPERPPPLPPILYYVIHGRPLIKRCIGVVEVGWVHLASVCRDSMGGGWSPVPLEIPTSF